MNDKSAPLATSLTASRSDLVDRFYTLRPLLHRRLVTTAIPPDLQAEGRSLTIHQLEALARLAPSGLTMGALARALGITDGSAAVLSDRLVKQGLAARKPDAKDRRVVWLEPSEQALVLLRRFHASERRSVDASLRMLSDPELATLITLLEKVGADQPAEQCD